MYAAMLFQVGNVRHVGHEVAAVEVGDLAEALVVEVARVAGDAGDDHLRLEEVGALLQLVVVDQAGRGVDLEEKGKRLKQLLTHIFSLKIMIKSNYNGKCLHATPMIHLPY